MCLACQLASAILSLLTLLPDLPCCTQLNLSRNQIGAEGAKPLADALRVCPSLTSIDLASNSIGSEFYVKPHELSGASLTEGSKVTYQGREVTVLQEEDEEGDVQITNVGILELADALRVSASITSVR